MKYIIICTLILISCSKKEPLYIEAPKNYVLSIESYWGLVMDDYIRILQEPALDSLPLEVLRKDNIFKITRVLGQEQYFQSKKGQWVAVELETGLKGWVFSAGIKSYASKESAILARKYN